MTTYASSLITADTKNQLAPASCHLHITHVEEGRVQYPTGSPPRMKVCILGGAPMDEPVPYDSTDYEIWGCNALWRRGFNAHGQFRADRWFELHPSGVQTVQELQAIQYCPIPLYVWPGWTDGLAPTRIEYPLERVCQLWFTWNHRPHRYFTNTFALQVALAIAEGFTTIRLCNIWLTHGRELCVERACLEFWLGVATGHGVTLELSRQCPLLQHPFLYGRDYWEEKGEVEARLRDVLSSIAHDGFAGSK